MRRIAILISGLEGGGAELQAAALARTLSARGWEVQVFAFRGGPVEEVLRTAGIPVTVSGPAGLVAGLARFKPAIVHAHLFHANLAARLARLFVPVPVVISSVHSMAETKRNSNEIGRRDLLYRLTNSLSDATVFVSAACAERHREARAVTAGKIRVIPNGVDTAQFCPDEVRRIQTRAALGLHDEFVWLAAGRFMWKKNYPVLLEAFANTSNSLLLIAGVGPDEANLRRIAGPNVRFVGARGDLPALMNGCDAFALSSDVEGLPMVLLEAASSGLPQVATDVGGVSDIVLHERTGYVVPRGDAAALAGAMQRLGTHSPDERLAMGRAAREHAVAHFDQPRVISEWESLYTELLDAARREAGEA